ncbi:MAG: RagB/SusD family nutrient uptake outer membrane protein [Bacteroidales bacterium]|nr:RagB/SusD family nutrient uptake outer membrane protein [Bacteroidales bacterium]
MKKYLLIALAASMAGLNSCNDDFMEKLPVESQTPASAFKTYENFKTYSWSFYSVFTSSSILRRAAGKQGYASAPAYLSDVFAGYLTRKGTSAYNPYAFQTVTNSATGNGWDFTEIRNVNIMLEHINDSEMTDSEKEHWRSVGYFFRAYSYMELIARFGDVPWVDKVLSDTETEIAYGPRIDRKTVADNVLDDLLYAEQYINANGDGANTVNKATVQALISRFALFEGSWRKYHNLGDYDKYFNEAIRSSEELMKSYPTINANYGEELTSNLAKMEGIILFKEYDTDALGHTTSTVERSSTHNIEMPQYMVDMYLCEDGKSISNSSLYEWGNTDKSMYSTFRNRDKRLLLTVTPPYEVTDINSSSDWIYNSNEASKEFIDIVGAATKEESSSMHKGLPLKNHAGLVLKNIPNISTNSTKPFCVSRGGYYVYKYYNLWDNQLENKNTFDVPLFKMNEVLLNYAEAKYEAGIFSQNVADATINKLRERANVASMQVSEINESFDEKRDPEVDPVLWEIRRERIVELMGEGFGFYDVRRWKKADWFVNKHQYGMWIQKSKIGNGKLVNVDTKLPDTSLSEGHIYLFDDPVSSGKGWLDKYYLYQVPTNEIALNPALAPNNPGW